MPIKGLTDASSAGTGLPVIARLYKGDEKPENGKRPGADLNYFRVEFEPQFEHLRSVWEGLYGKEPTEFQQVFLTAPTTDDAFSTWREEWNASQTLLHRCDGEQQVVWYDTTINQMSRARVACAEECKCKQIGRLNLLLPDFVDACGILGYVMVTTHSLNDILTVYRYLADVERLHGTLLNIPFVFGRAKREVSTPRQAKDNQPAGRIKTTKSLLYMHIMPEFAQQHTLRAITQSPALPAPPSISANEGKKLLGAGAGNGRKMADSPQVPSVFTDVKAAAKFLGFAQKEFDYGADDVVYLLGAAVDYEVAALTDWRGSPIEAVGALIAGHCEYDAAIIEQFTATRNQYRIEHRDAALATAQFAQELLAEVAEAAEAEGA